MARHEIIARAFGRAGLAALLFVASLAAARAQLVGEGNSPLAPPPVNSGRSDQFAQRSRGEEGLPVGTWLLYPSAFAGFSYDTNVNHSATNPQSTAGLRLAPDLRMIRDDGIHKTTLYGSADATIYTNQNAGRGSVVSAHAGGIEVYKPVPDLIFNGQLDYTRQLNLFSSLSNANSVPSLNTTGVGLGPAANSPPYNQYSGLLSAQKNFDRAFGILSGSIVDVTYDTSANTVAPSPNGVIYTGTARGGFWMIPTLYGYIEGSLDKRNYNVSVLSSSGYRAVAGVGSDQIGLMRGEVYAGYQSESGGTGTVGGTVLGARGYYYPLPELTISVSADESIGASLLTARPVTGRGTSTRVTTILGTANYALGHEWSLSGRGGYILTDYVGTTRNDDAWTVGSTLTYRIWRNIGLTFDYQHIDSSSNLPLLGYSDDVVTVGATYRY